MFKSVSKNHNFAAIVGFNALNYFSLSFGTWCSPFTELFMCAWKSSVIASEALHSNWLYCHWTNCIVTEVMKCDYFESWLVVRPYQLTDRVLFFKHNLEYIQQTGLFLWWFVQHHLQFFIYETESNLQNHFYHYKYPQLSLIISNSVIVDKAIIQGSWYITVALYVTSAAPWVKTVSSEYIQCFPLKLCYQ